MTFKGTGASILQPVLNSPEWLAIRAAYENVTREPAVRSTTKTSGTNNAGLWLFSRTPTVSAATKSEMYATLKVRARRRDRPLEWSARARGSSRVLCTGAGWQPQGQ